MKCLVLLVALAAVSANISFDEWAQEHGKVYTTWGQRMYRQQVWTKNLNKILSHNIRHIRGEAGYSMGMNVYGDLTSEEFRQQKTCFRGAGASNSSILGAPKVHYKGTVYMAPLNQSVPVKVDFRKLGFVTKVKDQGQCGSCWAFSSTGSIEGQHFRRTGKLISVSEQQLVDCSGKFGNEGCNGGLMESAFTYVMTTKGLMSETSYPYTGEDGECTYATHKSVSKVTGYEIIPSGNESMLVSAIAANGPISVSIDASQDSFQFYSKGVYDEPKCDPENLDHGVLAVGYGSMGGKDYYIVKNSWGTSWGDDGYILMSRNKKNQCGISSDASFPLV